MKAQLGYGGILLMLIIFSITVVYIVGGAEPVNRSIVTLEGKLISFENFANMFIKMFDQSIEFISQRSSYELGKTGGIQGSTVALWYENYPTIERLEEQLETAIEGNLPQGQIENGFTITFDEGSADTIWNNVDCDPLENYDCFFVDGKKSISIYDESTDSKISLNPHEFYIKVSSDYFKLLRVGRAIMEEGRYNQFLGDYGRLTTELNSAKNPSSLSFDPRFENLIFTLNLISENIVEVTIKENCYPPDYHCLAPLKAGEVGFDPSIPYDYVTLTFRYNQIQTSYTEPDYDFILRVNPFEGDLEVVCS